MNAMVFDNDSLHQKRNLLTFINKISNRSSIKLSKGQGIMSGVGI